MHKRQEHKRRNGISRYYYKSTLANTRLVLYRRCECNIRPQLVAADNSKQNETTRYTNPFYVQMKNTKPLVLLFVAQPRDVCLFTFFHDSSEPSSHHI